VVFAFLPKTLEAGIRPVPGKARPAGPLAGNCASFVSKPVRVEGAALPGL